MKIGFDLDGVLANFVAAYQGLFVEVTGRDLFQPGDIENPPCWDWPQFRGYTKDEVTAVWTVIKADPLFWWKLAPIEPSRAALDARIAQLEQHHDVYFITSRPGVQAKRQSEQWLQGHLSFPRGLTPTVLIVGTGEKGAMCKALKLDAYIDDHLENVWHCATDSPKTHTFLLDRHYNRDQMPRDVTRVSLLSQFLDAL